jgi:hypothetical protein
MKKTIDTGTGKVFRYNEIVQYLGYNVPCRMTVRKSMHLHPTRVVPELLAELNPGVVPVIKSKHSTSQEAK